MIGAMNISNITGTWFQPTWYLLRQTCGRVLLALLAAVLSACVSPPFVTDGISTDLRPVDWVEKDSRQTQDGNPAAGTVKPEKVLWGGVVINAANTVAASEIEILSYPLDYLQRPDVSRASTGRFLLVVDDYVETADFAAGRRVTALGRVDGTESGRIGESEYLYPVLKLDTSADLHRWTAEEYYNSSPVSPIGIGIGISISN